MLLVDDLPVLHDVGDDHLMTAEAVDEMLPFSCAENDEVRYSANLNNEIKKNQTFL